MCLKVLKEFYFSHLKKYSIYDFSVRWLDQWKCASYSSVNHKNRNWASPSVFSTLILVFSICCTTRRRRTYGRRAASIFGRRGTSRSIPGPQKRANQTTTTIIAILSIMHRPSSIRLHKQETAISNTIEKPPPEKHIHQQHLENAKRDHPLFRKEKPYDSFS